MNQQEFIHQYIEKTAERFNETLFTRSDDKIIDNLENIILSCERNGLIKIKVLKFIVIDDYIEIRNYLRNLRDVELSKKGSVKKGLKVNQYQYINMKDSDIKLLIVRYYIATKGEEDIIEVPIAVPRVVNKFYFHLNGCYYSSMYQVVDASTYNTSTSKSSNKHYITLKTIFQPIRVFRNINSLTTIDGTPTQCSTFDNNTFKKSVPVGQYLLAKYGLYETIKFLGIYGSIYFTDLSGAKDKAFANEYVFKAKRNSNIYIHVDADLYDKTLVLQHFVYILHITPTKNDTYDQIFTNEYWVNALGILFNSSVSTLEKGSNILNSLELIYDIPTKDEIQLPEEYKHDIYHILRWILWEYNNLRTKDNLNILTKKIKSEDYIGSMYAAKISRNIYRLSDKAKDADLKMIRSHLTTPVMEIINRMIQDQLITFRGISSDMDSMLANKFTYKGSSGIKTISAAYKLIHPSNIGILDPDSSSPSDPGVSGTIVPMVTLYDNNYFSDFQEPLTFERDYATLHTAQKEANGMIEVFDLREKLLHDKTISDQQKIEAAKTAENIRNIIKTVGLPEYVDEKGEKHGYPLEASGVIQYVTE